MALQLGATRAAFIAAGVPEDKAAAASEELASYQSQFSGLREEMQQGFARVDREFVQVRSEMQQGFARVDREFAQVRSEMRQGFALVDQKFAKVRGDINLLRWMTATNIALTAGVLFRILTH
nr:hypothetical protein [uncultured Rhodopila sp.]